MDSSRHVCELPFYDKVRFPYWVDLFYPLNWLLRYFEAGRKRPCSEWLIVVKIMKHFDFFRISSCRGTAGRVHMRFSDALRLVSMPRINICLRMQVSGLTF